MNIELSQHELDLLDAALVAWANEPHHQAMTKAVMGTMLRALTKKPENPTDDPFDPEVEMKQGTAEAKDRERKALLLRAKLAQASAMQSEHEVQP